jgi:cell division protein FtsL
MNSQIKELWQRLNKFYLANISVAAAVAMTVILMFAVQFKVESLQDEVVKAEGEIAAFEDEIQLLEVEWVYLTRPERLRNLASRFLQDNSYMLASQIKDESRLEQYYLVNYKKSEEREVALSQNFKESELEL